MRNVTWNIYHFHSFISFTSFRLKTEFGHRHIKSIKKLYYFKRKLIADSMRNVTWNIYHCHSFISFASFCLKTEFGHRHIKSIKKLYIFKENQSPILWEMWLIILFTFMLSSHSHHFIWRLNLVTDISSPSTNFIFLKKINRRFYEKCDMEYFSLSFFHLIRIIWFEDGIWSPTYQVYQKILYFQRKWIVDSMRNLT
jgi:hypothetical protein